MVYRILTNEVSSSASNSLVKMSVHSISPIKIMDYLKSRWFWTADVVLRV